jgi:hypothetical protein
LADLMDVWGLCEVHQPAGTNTSQLTNEVFWFTTPSG